MTKIGVSRALSYAMVFEAEDETVACSQVVLGLFLIVIISKRHTIPAITLRCGGYGWMAVHSCSCAVSRHSRFIDVNLGTRVNAFIPFILISLA